jgi:hypothetical protein
MTTSFWPSAISMLYTSRTRNHFSRPRPLLTPVPDLISVGQDVALHLPVRAATDLDRHRVRPTDHIAVSLDLRGAVCAKNQRTVLRIRHERLSSRLSLDQFGPLPQDVDNVGTGSLARTDDLAGSLHQFVLLQFVDLFYLLRRTTHRIVWAMCNHGDVDLAVGNCERLDLRAVAQQ